MKTLHIDPKWRVENDAHSFKLIFNEERQKPVLDKKKKPTGEMEDYIYEDSWYYPTLSMCLKRYVTEVVKYDGGMDEVIERLDRIEKRIDEIKVIFKK